MGTLQALITVVSILVTVALLVLQLRRATKRIRLRPRLDIVRIVVQFAAVIVVAALLGTGAPIVALVRGSARRWAGLPAGPQPGHQRRRRQALRRSQHGRGHGVGRRSGDHAGRRAAEANRHPRSGSATAWVGVGLAVGLFLGRSGPLTNYRHTAGRVAAPVSAVVMGLLALATFGDGRPADAQDAGEWVLAGEQVNPGGDAPPAGLSSPSAPRR